MRPLIRGAGGLFKPQVQQPSSPIEAPNTLRSRTVADALFLVGEGPIVAPPDLYRAVYLNDVPVKSEDGTFNFANVSLALSLGYPDQPYIPGTPAAETTIGIGQKVTAGTPIVQAISDGSATAASAIITIPALVVTDPANGNQNPTSVAIAIDVQPNGGSYQTVVTDTIYGKCISPVQREYRFQLPGSAPWNVRVRRLTADSNSSNLQNETHWYSLAVRRDYRLAYPDSAILRLIIDAEQFSGQFPTVKYRGRHLIVPVPSNYDPVARTYAGLWDGSFQPAWTDNPAWVIWSAMTNDRWGLGRYIDLAAVDKWGLYALSQFCDELLPDGKGGLEPRYTFNGTFESVAKAYDALNTLAGAVQAMTYWASGAANVVIDRPADPVKQVAPANVVDGKFTYQGSDIATRPTAVHVTWYDPANGYQRAVEPYEDPDLIARYGLRIKEVVAALCTSQGQAARTARYLLETEWSEGEVVTYGVGEDQADVLPGDHVDIADPSIQARRVGGRLLAIDGTTITLDAPVTLDPGHAYTLRVVGADNKL